MSRAKTTQSPSSTNVFLHVPDRFVPLRQHVRALLPMDMEQLSICFPRRTGNGLYSCHSHWYIRLCDVCRFEGYPSTTFLLIVALISNRFNIALYSLLYLRLRKSRPGKSNTWLDLFLKSGIFSILILAVITMFLISGEVILDHSCTLVTPPILPVVFLVGDSGLSAIFIWGFFNSLSTHTISLTPVGSKTKADTVNVYLNIARRNLKWSLICIVSTFLSMLLTALISMGVIRAARGPQWPKLISMASGLIDVFINMCCMLSISHSWIPKKFTFLQRHHPTKRSDRMASELASALPAPNSPRSGSTSSKNDQKGARKSIANWLKPPSGKTDNRVHPT